jgi:hypothetical protein
MPHSQSKAPALAASSIYLEKSIVFLLTSVRATFLILRSPAHPIEPRGEGEPQVDRAFYPQSSRMSYFSLFLSARQHHPRSVTQYSVTLPHTVISPKLFSTVKPQPTLHTFIYTFYKTIFLAPFQKCTVKSYDSRLPQTWRMGSGTRSIPF